MLDNSISMEGKPITQFLEYLSSFFELIKTTKRNYINLSLITYNSSLVNNYDLIIQEIISEGIPKIKCLGKSDFYNGFKSLQEKQVSGMLIIMTAIAPYEGFTKNEIEYINSRINTIWNSIEGFIQTETDPYEIMRDRVIVITYKKNYVYDWFKRYFDNVFEIESFPPNQILDYF